MNCPTIRIKDAWLLRENASTHLHTLWAKDGEKLESDKDIDVIVAAYQKAWKPYEAKIIQGMCEGLDLEFRQNIVDVYIAPWFYAFSDPLVIGTSYTPDRFIEVLTHELLHRLLTDNTIHKEQTRLKVWQSLFGAQHSFKVLAHIPVHAAYQMIFDDVVQEPARTKNDIAKCQNNEAYRLAWEYVDNKGYKSINNQLRQAS